MLFVLQVGKVFRLLSADVNHHISKYAATAGVMIS